MHTAFTSNSDLFQGQILPPVSLVTALVSFIWGPDVIVMIMMATCGVVHITIIATVPIATNSSYKLDLLTSTRGEGGDQRGRPGMRAGWRVQPDAASLPHYSLRPAQFAVSQTLLSSRPPLRVDT